MSNSRGVRSLARLHRDELTGRVVIDACNYLPYRDGRDRAIDEGRTSTTEVLAQHLPYSRIVKGLNTIAAGQIIAAATPPGTPNRRALPIAGDDPTAKQPARRPPRDNPPEPAHGPSTTGRIAWAVKTGRRPGRGGAAQSAGSADG